MELERNRISFISLEASMTFARKSSLRSHLTAKVAEIFSQAFRKKKNHWITSKGSSTEKMPCKPLCGQCQPIPLIHSSLETVSARGRSAVLGQHEVRGAELRSEDALKELFIYPPGGWGVWRSIMMQSPMCLGACVVCAQREFVPRSHCAVK